jgi:hypothetical protein
VLLHFGVGNSINIGATAYSCQVTGTTGETAQMLPTVFFSTGNQFFIVRILHCRHAVILVPHCTFRATHGASFLHDCYKVALSIQVML